MKSLKEMLSELAASGHSISLNPTTIKQLREQGINIPERQRLTPEQSINILFSEQRKEKALQMYQQLPERPDIPVTSIQSLYLETRAAIILGLHVAAITLSCILVEYALKYATYTIEVGGFAKNDSEKWNEFEGLDFARAIVRANKSGLLTKEIKKSLNDFRVRFRNPHSHYNIRKITADYSNKTFASLNTRTNEVEIRDGAAKHNRVLQALVKPLVDADNVLEVFKFADSVVRYLWTQISDLPIVHDPQPAQA